MADKTLTSLVGDGNWVVKSFHTAAAQVIATGAIGEILRITPPSGCKVLVTHLTTGATSNDISVSLGAREVFNGPLNDDASQGNLTVASAYATSTAIYIKTGLLTSIEGKVDEDFVLNSAIATTQVIFYSYAIMEQS